MAVKLNYRINGEKLTIKWFGGEDEFLGEKEYIFNQDYYETGYSIFEITNQFPWPYDEYRIELYYNDTLYKDYVISVMPDEDMGLSFIEENLYNSEEFNFEINYPDGWSYEEEENKNGLKVSFMPESEEFNSVLNMRVFNRNYYPQESDYLEFADELISEITELGDAENVEKTVNDIEVAGIGCKEVVYSYLEEEESGWEIRLSFIYRSDRLYLFMSVADFYNLEFTRTAYLEVLNTFAVR